MEDKVEASEDKSEEVKETLVDDTKGNGEEPEEATSKNDLNCKKCVEENEGTSRGINRKESQVRFNDVVETHEVETEYDKPDRTLNFLKGFGKRVILCTLLIFIAKTAWPRIQPIVWPEEPVKVRSFMTKTLRTSHINKSSLSSGGKTVHPDGQKFPRPHQSWRPFCYDVRALVWSLCQAKTGLGKGRNIIFIVPLLMKIFNNIHT